jgi:serine/threonine protein kinase
VWSLGATLYHLLAGHPPYDVNENLMGALYKIVHEDPPRLADAGWLSTLLEHTMSRRPDDRWSMSQVRDFLGEAPAVAVIPPPVVDTDTDGTRVLQPTPSEPVAVPPVVVDPELARHLAPEPAVRRGRSPWPWVAGAVLLLAVAVIVGAALVGSRGGDGSPSAGGPSGTRSSTSDSSSSSGTEPQVAAMRSFIADYLSTVTSDQHTSWAMLTPGFQRASGGFGKYQQYWRTIQSATPRDITPDPATLSVTYGVDYVRTDGSTASDQVTLQLVRDGSSYLIDGES